MRIDHCLGWYLPESSGGTEAYVRSLALAQQARGARVRILAPRDGQLGAHYEHDGLKVVRYPVPEERSVAQHEGREPHARFDAFCEALAEDPPAIFHLHSSTYGAGHWHLREARRHRARTVVTAHMPGFVCMRGTMMRMGVEPCDGRVRAEQCVPCWMETRGVPAALLQPLGELVRRAPAGLVERAPGRLRLLLGARARVRGQRSAVLQLCDLADRVVAVCDWLRQALIDNGVAPDRVLRIRQAVQRVLPDGERGPRPRAGEGGPLRVGFFGRANRVKGLDLLVRAVRNVPAAPVALRLHALTGTDAERAHLAEVEALAAGDPRIRFVEPVSPDAVQDAMRDHHVIAVPSRWLETGPMVAMDALAAGIPVLGSDLGGLRELVEPGVTGWLEPVDDVGRWSRRIEALSAPGAAALSWEPRRPGLQTWGALATRMLELYGELA